MTTSKQSQLDAIEARMREIKARIERTPDTDPRWLDYRRAFEQLDAEWSMLDKSEA
jgi:hypothetical protein